VGGVGKSPACRIGRAAGTRCDGERRSCGHDAASRYLFACELLSTTKESLRLSGIRGGAQGVRPHQGHSHQ